MSDKQVKTAAASTVQLSEEERHRRERDRERSKNIPPTLLYYKQTERGTWAIRRMRPGHRMRLGI